MFVLGDQGQEGDTGHQGHIGHGVKVLPPSTLKGNSHGFWDGPQGPNVNQKRWLKSFPGEFIKCSCFIFVPNFRLSSLSRTTGCDHPSGLDSHLPSLPEVNAYTQMPTFKLTREVQWQNQPLSIHREFTREPDSSPDSCHVTAVSMQVELVM